MPRIYLLLCSGVCLLNTADITAQALPKKPTIQQVVGYRLQQQQSWNRNQLPQNSVLYKYNADHSAWRSYDFTFKKDKLPGIPMSFSGLYKQPLQDNIIHQGFFLHKRSAMFRQWLYSRDQSWKRIPQRIEWMKTF